MNLELSGVIARLLFCKLVFVESFALLGIPSGFVGQKGDRLATGLKNVKQLEWQYPTTSMHCIIIKK